MLKGSMESQKASLKQDEIEVVFKETMPQLGLLRTATLLLCI
jgi:hypothetical protein